METGYYYTDISIKKDATPIDNIIKFAWYDDDYVEVQKWHEYTEEELQRFAESAALEEQQIKDRNFLDNGPDVQASQDIAICELYEMLVGE